MIFRICYFIYCVGVYLGNFMHDFRHAAPSQTNVPIANSAGHINGTVYDIELMDQYGSPVPVTHISSHYGGMGHKIDSSVDADGNHFSDNGRFSIHIGCTDFLGQFLYFQFKHQGMIRILNTNYFEKMPLLDPL